MRFFIVLCVFISIKNLAQTITPTQKINENKSRIIDSLTQKLNCDSVHTYRFKKFRPYANIDNRNSFIQSTPINLRGIRLGLIYKEKHTMGFGLYMLTQNRLISIKTKYNTVNSSVNERLNLNYTTFFYQYTLYKRKYWEIDIPFEIGKGSASITIEDSSSKKTIRTDVISIIPVGGGLQIVFKPIKWVGISAMGGYRYVKDKDRKLNFNGTYYSMGLWIDFRQIYRDIKYYKIIKKRYRNKIKSLLQ